MSRILCFETATKNCSAALFDNGVCIGHREEYNEKYSHSERLLVLIQELLDSSPYEFTDLSAICLGKGPGSYTGLRIGSATAKGLCYAHGTPLISLTTLDILMQDKQILEQEADFFIPMLDARRMEVYQSVFDSNKNQIQDISAEVIDEKTFQKYQGKRSIIFGDGADKLDAIQLPEHVNILRGIRPSAKNMGALADEKLKQEKFEDTAYFEPFYLKEFVAGKPKKLFP